MLRKISRSKESIFAIDSDSKQCIDIFYPEAIAGEGIVRSVTFAEVA